MKILFVVQDIDFLSPLGLMQISAMAKLRGDETYLAVLSREDIFEKIQQLKPDVVAYSSTTGEHNYYARLNKIIKSRYKNIFTIMGGPHATYFQRILDEADLDAICVGEGEYAFPELLEGLEQGKDLSNLESIIVKGGKLKGMKPLVQDLDELPFPDRELFYGSNNFRDNQVSIMNFMTTRGCPYNCTYCFNHAFNKLYSGETGLRSHSVDYVIREILDAKRKYDFKFVRFVDDTFVIKSKEWLREFSERYPAEVGLPFYVHSRFDLITPNNILLLKKAGCVVVQMSIESTNVELRKKILGRKMSDEVIAQGAKHVLESGISIIAYTMLALPTSELKDDINAVDFCIKLRIPVPEFPIYQPFPKTELGEMCVKKGWFDGDMSKIDMYGALYPTVLTCFSDKEKNAQINIGLLGPMVVRNPFLRNLVMNYLIYLPTNKLYERIYTIGKMLNYPTMVYKRKYSLVERFKLFKKGLAMEKIRRSQNIYRQKQVRSI